MAGREIGIAGAVLAGGAGRRLGGIPKSQIRLNGVSLLQKTLDLLAGLFEEIVLVAGEPERLRETIAWRRPEGELLLARDVFSDRGPLGGIHAGLARTSREAVFFVACDMPFLRKDLIRRMSRGFLESGCDLLVPRIGGMIEPVHAFYRTRLAGPIHRHLSAGGDPSIRAIIDRHRACYLELADTPRNRRTFLNLNTPADLRRLQAEGLRVETGGGR
jgi:molybdopterin-guanine dinucleotide biosynthesis protein A